MFPFRKNYAVFFPIKLGFCSPEKIQRQKSGVDDNSPAGNNG